MTTRSGVYRVVRFAWKRCILAAVLHGVSRFLILLGVLCLVGWSYTLWGMPGSPLGVLFWPGVILLVLAVPLNLLVRRLLAPRCDALEEIRASREVHR